MEDQTQRSLLEGEENGWRTTTYSELKKILRIAIPGILARTTSFGLVVVTQMFLGHTSSSLLSAFALEQTVILRFVNSIMIGMSCATETLCGQGFGAGQHHMLGIYLQRSWIVNVVTVTVCVPFFIFSKQLLLMIGQQESIADAAATLSPWFVPLVYSFVFYSSIQMYLQSQMKNHIIGWLTTPAFLLHIIFSFLLVQKLGFGVTGAMISLVAFNWFSVIGEFVYLFGGWCHNTWKGFDKAAFVDLWPVVKLSLSSGLMICLQLWYVSILILVAGYLPNVEVQISAFSICLNINALQNMVCLGFQAAASVRVSNELGRRDVKSAKFSMKVILFVSVTIGILSFICYLIFSDEIANLYTNSADVKETLALLSFPLALSLLINSFQAVLYGIATGAGMQAPLAFVNLGTYYLIGLPLGICLAYLTNLKVVGICIGLLSGIVLQVIIVAVVIMRSDWDEQVEIAWRRVNRWYVKEEEAEGDEER